MSERGNIPLKNVFYMLSYSYKELKEGGRIDLSNEDFENATDLFAAILARGTSSLVRRGLTRDYIRRIEPLAFPRGKFDIAGTIRSRSLNYRKVVCSYDEHSEDTQLNRIVKTSMMALCAKSAVSQKHKRALRLMLDYFENVSTIDLRTVKWGDIRFRREEAPYRLLILICEMAVRHLFIQESEDEQKAEEYIDDDHMHQLFEDFLHAYFNEEHPMYTVDRGEIKWELDGGFETLNDDERSFLPNMKDDVRIEDPATHNALIMDAKWYQDPTPSNQYGDEKIRNAHLYQIFAYVKNYEKTQKLDGHVSGMLVYPETNTRLRLHYPIGGNSIWVRTVDLSQEFAGIREELDDMLHTWTDYPHPM